MEVYSNRQCISIKNQLSYVILCHCFEKHSYVEMKRLIDKCSAAGIGWQNPRIFTVLLHQVDHYGTAAV